MPSLSLTDFVDIASASGTPKATKVRQIRRRPPYSPAADFNKLVRETIVAAHEEGLGKKHLDCALSSTDDKKKHDLYPAVIKGYRKWWGRKALDWFEPPRAAYEHLGVVVRVNPELGLVHKDEGLVIKLYFKSDKLTKARVDVSTHLMSVSLRMPDGYVMSVLDVRRSKLIHPTVPIPDLTATLNAELAYVADLWAALDGTSASSDEGLGRGP